ncbi:hypothetical protein GCM10007989_11050 [Devosia pacifica]|uniref:PsbP C-terminal domain-containing protein n=1 Tax=Devosia pacifica TaxID=1335967 RepID=A0A918VPN4_9HYPH|nr:hypothetical protein [Devosia pacifica]GHA17642.1 hypothetical protein GCM10007989_11050 [Devosia pacifica]
MRLSKLTTLLVFAVLSVPATAQGNLGWSSYDDRTFGYTVDIPGALYSPAESSAGSQTYLTSSGEGQLSVFGAPNTEGYTTSQLEQAVRDSGQIPNITYSAGGERWFVLSGLSRQADGTDLIVYTKFLLNRDRSAFSAFEISYPADQKARYNAVVTRIEKSLRAPQL